MAIVNHFYKKNYSEAEFAECFDWFERNMDYLPESVMVSKGFYVKNCTATARHMLSKLRNQMHGNGIYNGEFANLLMLREAIQRQEDFEEQTSITS